MYKLKSACLNMALGLVLALALCSLAAVSVAPGITSITGTANQVTASPTRGNVVLTLPQDIATASSPSFTGLTISGLTATRVVFAGVGGILSDDSDLTFATDTLTATKLRGSTSVSTPSIITASGALSVTPTSGSGVNITLTTTGDFLVNSTQFSVDTSQGFVGIGTAAPSRLLDVASDGTGTDVQVVSYRTSGDGGNGALLGFDTTNKRIYFKSNAGATYDFDFQTAAGTSRMIIDLSTGNVGVGDTSPASLFTVGSGDLFQVNSSGTIAAVVGVTSSSDISTSVAGKGFKIKEGSNARMGQSILVNGTVTVSNTSVAANTRIFVSRAAINASTTIGALEGGTIIAATSFVINSYTSAAIISTGDQSTVNWVLIDPSP